MLLKRFLALLVALAILMPGISISAPYTYPPAFAKAYLAYDASRGVFVDTATRADNWCRISKDWRDPTTGRSCWDPHDVPAIVMIVPHTVYCSSNAPAASAPMRGARRIEFSNAEIAVIAYAAAEALRKPDAFTRKGLALDENGKSADVFGDTAVKRDALGWILKCAARQYGSSTKERRALYRISERINDEVRRRTGKSLVAINDECGCEAVVRALEVVADRLSVT